MPKGAPDWIQLADQSFRRYKSFALLRAWAAVADLPDWSTVLDKDMTGAFGYLWATANDPFMNVRVTIDEIIIFNFNAGNLKSVGLWGAQNPWDKMGVVRYDEVTERYNIFYDEKWGMYIEENLKIELQYDIGGSGNGSCRIYWKELV